MAYSTEGEIISMIAENTMAEKYVVVELGTSAQQVDLPDNSADQPFGVILDTATAGQAVPVQKTGITKCVANGAITKGSRLNLIVTTGRVDDNLEGTAGTVYVGRALEAATAAGDIISVDLSILGTEDGGAS